MNDKAKTEGQGKAVVLPNGERRIDFIRDAYYNKTGAHTDKCKSRSDIKNEINEMLEKAGREGEQILYQIVFAATKTPEDPRIAAKAREKVKATEKVAKEKAAKEVEAAAKKAAAKK
jgi:hypothetical protein